MLSATYSELLKGNKNFRRLWSGQLISELGTWFSFIAELGLVRMFSGSALATTALLIARLLPFLLVAPVAGVFVDRRSRKRIMIATDLLRAMVALLYLAAASLGSVWAVCVCSAMMSSLAVFFEAAKNASIPNLVSPRELLTANVLMFSTRFLQFTLGSALGGVTAARFGYNIAFVVDSLSFIASASYIALIPAMTMRKARPSQADGAAIVAAASAASSQSGAGEGDRVVAQAGDPLSAEEVCGVSLSGSEQPVEQARHHLLTDLREGLAYIWATPFVRAVIMVNVGWAVGGGMNNILYDQIGGHLFVEGERGDWSVAMLFKAAGVGLFLGMLLARRAGAWAAEERRATHFIGWSLVTHGILFSIAGLMPSLILIALCIAMSRLIVAMEFGVQETMVMKIVPDEYRGRVFTTDRSLELGMMTVSMIIGGWLLKWFSPMTMMVISGMLSASPGVVWLLAMWLRRFSVPARAVREGYGD
ncbi:MAG TPA: MFS transporter [Blastocatellia bacterium]|nr:MFS transporter [Blastocatellia bacterium]